MAIKEKVIVAITGASGSIYAIRLLEQLKAYDVEVHFIMSKSAKLTLKYEVNSDARDVEALADVIHANSDIGASIASGSFRNRGMIIAPCSMKTLAEISSGVTGSLISRSADVTLKERRPLILLTRETPLNLIHIKNMKTATEAGAVIFPPVPAFYNKPASLEEMVDYTILRVLDLLGYHADTEKRWTGEKPGA